MGVLEAAIALPSRRIPEKALRQAGRARGYEALRVPWWDEDPLTLALDAALQLGDRVGDARRIVLALDASHLQSSLVTHALGLDVPTIEVDGPLAGYEALEAVKHRSTLVLAGGAQRGGAGVALLLGEGGVPIEAGASVATRPLGGSGAAGLRSVLDQLPDEGPLRVPAGTPGLRSLGRDLAPSLTRRVGNAGAAGLLVELVHGLSEDGGPVRVAGQEPGRAVALVAGEGRLDASASPGTPFDVDVQAWDRLDASVSPAWSEASQGAYVSRQAYDADPEARYGARAMGEGTVASVTTIQAGPPGEFVRQHEAAGPYDVVIVELDDGGRRIAQSALPPGEVAIGDRVRPVLRRLFSMEEQWRYALKVVHA